jgi:hypothetical protein
MKRLRPRLVFASALALLLTPAAAPAGEHYYLLLFGSQDQPKHLRNTHTWATFVRAVGEGSDPAGYQLFVHTISWYPATLELHVWDLRPETGVNLTLEQTLEIVLANREQVRLWGPFVIDPSLYNRSVEVFHILQSGRARYRAISGNTDLYVGDCIHAVAAVDPIFGRGHYPLIRIGHPASRFIAREIMVRGLERGIDQTRFDNSWLIPALGLERYPISVVPPQAIPFQRCFLCTHPD